MSTTSSIGEVSHRPGFFGRLRSSLALAPSRPLIPSRLVREGEAVDDGTAGHVSPRPRILILSASAGGGHLRAAQAVQLALEQVCPEAIVANVDVLALTNVATRRLYSRGYYRLVDHAPHLIGYLYDRLDGPPRPSRRTVLDRASERLQRLNFAPAVRLLERGGWDLAINTHFLPAEIIAGLRSAGRVSFPQVTVTTDFYAHRMWATPPCDRYFTASEDARASLTAHAPADTIAATGIPIHPAFAEPADPRACRARHGIGNDCPVVLQLAGGFGFGPVDAIHRGILDVNRPLHVVVAAGRNAAAKQRLEAIPCPPRHRRTVFAYTDAMHELMAAADLIVSKPGGLTTSEALARGTAMVIVDPIPGQENRNSDFLLENGAAVKVNTPATLAFKLETLLGDESRLASMRARAAALGRPRAAFDVAQQAVDLIDFTRALRDRSRPRHAAALQASR